MTPWNKVNSSQLLSSAFLTLGRKWRGGAWSEMVACPPQTCNLRLKTPWIFHSFGLGAKINIVMERKAGRLQRGSWRARPWEMVNWVSLTWSGSLWGRALRQMCWEQCSQASCLGPSMAPSDEHGSAEVAAASGKLSHHSPTRCSSQQPLQLGRKNHSGAAGLGREVQLPPLCLPGVNRWVMDLPLP